LIPFQVPINLGQVLVTLASLIGAADSIPALDHATADGAGLVVITPFGRTFMFYRTLNVISYLESTMGRIGT
jgi:hypothetical protein